MGTACAKSGEPARALPEINTPPKSAASAQKQGKTAPAIVKTPESRHCFGGARGWARLHRRAGTPRSRDAGGGLLRALTYVVQLVAVGVGYYLLDLGSVKVVAAHPNAVALWPPTGLAFAAVMLGGYRMLPAIFVAGFLTHAVPFGPSYGAAAIAAGNTLEAFVLS